MVCGYSSSRTRHHFPGTSVVPLHFKDADLGCMMDKWILILNGCVQAASDSFECLSHSQESFLHTCVCLFIN